MYNDQAGRPIFGIGLSKTATTSLNAALVAFGYRAIHWPIDPVTIREVERCSIRLSLLNQYDALTDCSVPIVAYEALAEAYPSSLFILSVRTDESAWLRSIERHWFNRDATLSWDSVNFASSPEIYAEKLYRLAVFGGLGFDRSHFLNVYRAHWSRVLVAFRKYPTRLLVHSAEQGYAPLARFLGRPVPAGDYPRLNVTA